MGSRGSLRPMRWRREFELGDEKSQRIICRRRFSSSEPHRALIVFSRVCCPFPPSAAAHNLSSPPGSSLTTRSYLRHRIIGSRSSSRRRIRAHLSLFFLTVRISKSKIIIKILNQQRHRPLRAHPGARRGLREGGPGVGGNQEERTERCRRRAELGRVSLKKKRRREEEERARRRNESTSKPKKANSLNFLHLDPTQTTTTTTTTTAPPTPSPTAPTSASRAWEAEEGQARRAERRGPPPPPR